MPKSSIQSNFKILLLLAFQFLAAYCFCRLEVNENPNQIKPNQTKPKTVAVIFKLLNEICYSCDTATAA